MPLTVEVPPRNRHRIHPLAPFGIGQNIHGCTDRTTQEAFENLSADLRRLVFVPRREEKEVWGRRGRGRRGEEGKEERKRKRRKWKGKGSSLGGYGLPQFKPQSTLWTQRCQLMSHGLLVLTQLQILRIFSFVEVDSVLRAVNLVLCPNPLEMVGSELLK